MIPKELARRIRSLEIVSRKVVHDILAGEYGSVFKGRGMEFDEVREYQPGDDVRTIDWNVTARTGRPFVKRFREERELTVLLLVDLSASGRLGSKGRSKNELAAEICALLALAAARNNDRVGLMVFTEDVERFVPPGKGTCQVLKVIREVLGFEPARKGTDLGRALLFLGRLFRRRAIVFLISDFQAGGAYRRPLRALARVHDLIAVRVVDPLEMELPRAGLVELEDGETGEIVLVDLDSERFRESYSRRALLREKSLAAFFRSAGVDEIRVEAGGDHGRALVEFFRKRERRR
jgi:uncharacterized protein (DUF58 family)